MAISAAERFSTLRRDDWWIAPLVTVVVLVAFVIYTTWRALEGKYYLAEPYHSPFYSPLILVDWWPFSPAILILWAPALFRLTCYYYRKAYYRSFAWSPPACAVQGRESDYCGETKFPLILQNLHRYFFFPATILLAFLWYDAFKAFFFDGRLGVGIGTIILVANSFLLTMYSFSCHSFRHLIGGKLNVFSQCPLRFKLWKGTSVLNAHHMFWAWFSLFSVAIADLYVRLVATGALQDVRLV